MVIKEKKRHVLRFGFLNWYLAADTVCLHHHETLLSPQNTALCQEASGAESKQSKGLSTEHHALAVATGRSEYPSMPFSSAKQAVHYFHISVVTSKAWMLSASTTGVHANF